jgi:hypothetical protein
MRRARVNPVPRSRKLRCLDGTRQAGPPSSRAFSRIAVIVPGARRASSLGTGPAGDDGDTILRMAVDRHAVVRGLRIPQFRRAARSTRLASRELQSGIPLCRRPCHLHACQPGRSAHASSSAPRSRRFLMLVLPPSRRPRIRPLSCRAASGTRPQHESRRPRRGQPFDLPWQVFTTSRLHSTSLKL